MPQSIRIHAVVLAGVYNECIRRIAVRRRKPQERALSGLVTGIDGRVVASAVGSNQMRDLRAGDAVRPGDELRVGAGSMIEVLWNKQALFSLRDQTVVRLFEAKGGQIPVQILEGNVRIAYSYNEGHPTDTLTVITPDAHTVMREEFSKP